MEKTEIEEQEKQKLCQGRCNFEFQVTETETFKEDDNRVIEKVRQATLFCTVCTALRDLVYE